MTPSMISFTTDYGLSDGFVAACHGAIARLAPQARVLDVTHLIPPGDVRRAAAVLAQTVPSLPQSVHLAVVDPGVGTSRRPIALRTADGSLLVGPDNGLLLPAADALGGPTVAVHLTNRTWFADRVSHTFHGRDIFAPVAARLWSGADLREAGADIDDPVRLPAPLVSRSEGTLTAEVLTIDHFGNVQLAATADLLADTPRELQVNGEPATRTTTFAEAPEGTLVVLADSAGHVAVAVNGGNAATRLAAAPGTPITLTWPSPTPHRT
ncbi:SAM hydrolase/SAM-dependent halogenase family protein [Dactylosporangium sp. CA-092794]|uniref:SAM hydrolase/SAM-dependent halogenase family protein n=1 Tax=Dactylosporangium sp. CA-092794 TaxID=3239929 RepID=UPI003D947815